MKRIVSVFLSMVLLLGCFSTLVLPATGAERSVDPPAAFREKGDPTEGSCGPNVRWVYEANTATLRISGSGAMTDYGIEIWYDSVDPDVEEAVRSARFTEKEDRVKGYATDELAPWYLYNYHFYIETVIIEEGVTSIGSGAFFDCFCLSRVEIPESVTSIGTYAFDGCHDLEAVTLPAGLQVIGSWAFMGCSGLEEISIPKTVESIGCGPFANCGGLTAIGISEENPYYCADASGVLFNKEMTGLIQCPTGFRGAYAVPEGVTEIGHQAFYRCELESITFPEGLKVIGCEAFAWTDIGGDTVIPVTVEEIQSQAFYQASVGSLAIWNPDCEIGWDALYCSGVVFGYPGSDAEEATYVGYVGVFVGHLPMDGFCYICGEPMILKGQCGDDAYWELKEEDRGWTLYITGTGTIWEDTEYSAYNSLIRYVEISEGMTEIGGFQYFTELRAIQIPHTLTELGRYSFARCKKLEEIVLPTTITMIPDGCFDGCGGLRKVNIPDGVVSIGEGAFSGCYVLEEVCLPKGVVSIGEWAFTDCDAVTKLELGAQVQEIGSRAFRDCDKLEGIIVSEEYPYYSSDEAGILYTAEGTTLLAWPGGRGGDVVIPSQVKVIGESAFANCRRLDTAHVPATVEQVEEGAFANTSIRKLVYEPTYWLVPEDCFSGCELLEELWLGDEITTIMDWAFYDCRSLKEYTIGENVTYVGDYSFMFADAMERVTVLNPNCYLGTFAVGSTTKTVIYGYAGSTAEEYAKKYDLSFVALPEENRPEPEFTIADFVDCNAQWYQEGVDFMLRRGYMNGVGKNTFAPDNTLTRAMVVTVLFRVAGSPPYIYPGEFEDVPQGQWYTNPVAWAEYYGYVTGTDYYHFAPEMAITREQIATILWRYAGEPKAEGDLSVFTDAGDISDYAVEAMSWAVSVGILNGTGNGMLKPTANATRAQFACMVQRYLTEA